MRMYQTKILAYQSKKTDTYDMPIQNIKTNDQYKLHQMRAMMAI